MNVYAAAQDLYNYSELDGSPVYVEYLPTQRSRKWRKASLFIAAFDHKVCAGLDLRLKQENGWYQVRICKAYT
jgi:hypothetical protein